MKPFRVPGWVCALGLLVAEAGPLQAAWDNVFQVCCFGCRQRAAAGYYVAQAPPAVAAAPSPCCPPACPPVCTTRYSLRCYYQPITTYQTRTYYEPVCSYRYSCYYDPCSCSYQQVAVPTTSYQLRSQCCPVQSWVQR